jgi:hypothetical protein
VFVNNILSSFSITNIEAVRSPETSVTHVSVGEAGFSWHTFHFLIFYSFHINDTKIENGTGDTCHS